MTGIRKRVSIGFLSIVVLLFLSGLVSLFELNHMSADIDIILSTNRKSIEISEGMLNAIRANDRAVMQAYGFDIKNMTESTCVAELMKMYQKLMN